MKRKYVLWAMAAVVVLAGTAVLSGQVQQPRGKWGPGMMGHRGPLGFLARQLNLTDAQKAQIKAMWEAEKPTVQPLLQQLANGRKQMLSLTANGAFDQAKVSALANQQSQAIAQLIVEKEKLQSQIYSQVLTPEQRVKFGQLQQKRTARIDNWLQKLATGSSQSASPAPQNAQ
jgi:Spy/CpxP family protein refolding chaperone